MVSATKKHSDASEVRVSLSGDADEYAWPACAVSVVFAADHRARMSAQFALRFAFRLNFDVLAKLSVGALTKRVDRCIATVIRSTLRCRFLLGQMQRTQRGELRQLRPESTEPPLFTKHPEGGRGVRRGQDQLPSCRRRPSAFCNDLLTDVDGRGLRQLTVGGSQDGVELTHASRTQRSQARNQTESESPLSTTDAPVIAAPHAAPPVPAQQRFRA